MLIRSRPGIAPLRSALARWSPGPRPSICHDPLRSSAQRVVTGVAPDPIGGRERSAPDFARDDNCVVLGLLVDRAGRSARSRADRASDDGPYGPADDCANDGAGDSTSDRPTGLFVTVRGPGHIVHGVVGTSATGINSLSDAISAAQPQSQRPFAKLSLPMILRTFVRISGQEAAVRVSIEAAPGRTRDESAAIQFA